MNKNKLIIRRKMSYFDTQKTFTHANTVYLNNDEISSPLLFFSLIKTGLQNNNICSGTSIQ